MEFYYDIAPHTRLAKRLGSVTYHSKNKLKKGQVISIPYGKKTIAGVVLNSTKKPSFITKDISNEKVLFELNEDLLSLCDWLQEYYALDVVEALQLILPPKLHVRRRRAQSVNSQARTASKLNLPALTEDQQQAVRLISRTIKPSLLFGITGSGKTRVMLELLHTNLKTNKSAILLVPEISLSNQLVNSLVSAGFPCSHLHSELSEATYHTTWKNIHENKSPQIVVGPRSAIFAPVTNIGLILVDEAHDSAYKQDVSPHYNSIHVAARRAKISKSHLVLASATPNVADYYLAERQLINLVRLKKRIYNKTDHAVSVVDKSKKQQFSSSPILSDELIQSIHTSLQASELSLLFLNKRGFSPVIACYECGWRSSCTRCQSPLNYHRTIAKAICHNCGQKQTPPIHCPECGSEQVIYMGVGTQKLEKEINKLFPTARLLRIDSDVTKKADFSHQAFIENIRRKNIDILLGTQMITKGFDFESLTTVGVVDADTMLYVPDYRSEERTFQTLSQVIGRNDRRGQGARTVVQTLKPQNRAIINSLNEDFDNFYSYEIKQRQVNNYPPFCYLLKISTHGRSSKVARDRLTSLLAHIPVGVEVLGPISHPYKTANDYVWQVVLKASSRKLLVAIAKAHKQDQLIFNFDPLDLL